MGCRACECGDPDVASCRGAFDAALAAEFGDPEYFAVHHLTVSAYQVQHPRAYPRAGALHVLRRFLEDGVTPEQMRREIADAPRGNDGGPPRGAMQLASVRHDDPETYRADIERYARSVLQAAEHSRRRDRPGG